MATLPLDAFGGIAPLIDQRKLPPQGATLAQDCVFDGTDLRPLRNASAQASIGFTPSRMFKYRYQGAGTWLAWPLPHIVDVVPSPIAQDNLGRLYWTRYNPADAGPLADNYPRVASQPTQAAITGNTAAIRRLGIPAPDSAPALSEVRAASSIAPVTMSQTSPVTVTTATDHPFSDGHRVVVRFGVGGAGIIGVYAVVPTPTQQSNDVSMFLWFDTLNHGLEIGDEVTLFGTRGSVGGFANPFCGMIGRTGTVLYVTPNLGYGFIQVYFYGAAPDFEPMVPWSDPQVPGLWQRARVESFSGTVSRGGEENMSELSGREFVVGNAEARQFDLIGSDGAEYSAFTDPTGVLIERVYGESDIETRAYVYTFVSDWGEEGMPSDPTEPTDIRYDSGVELTIPTSVASPFNGYINRVRIYRTATGTQGAEFFYVGEASIPTPGNPVTFVDDVEPIALGEVLPSTDWAMPPNKLQGLVQMPNGFLAGFVGNTLYFSEPYMPHAWPDRYRKTVTDDIVGIAVYGQTLVVATKGQPYIVTGTDPGSVSAAKLDVYAPCLSKSGVCSIGMGVAYPSYDGMVVVSASGAQVVTQNHFTKTQWLGAWDVNMSCAWHDGRLIAFSSNPIVRTLIFQLGIQGALNVSTSTVVGSAPAIDDDDTLHFANGATRTKFDPIGATNMRAYWQSRVFTLSAARSMGVCQVFASGYPLTLTFGYANLASAHGQPSAVISSNFTATVSGPEPFRLPHGFLSREWRIMADTTHAVQRIVAAEVMDEIRQ